MEPKQGFMDDVTSRKHESFRWTTSRYWRIRKYYFEVENLHNIHQTDVLVSKINLSLSLFLSLFRQSSKWILKIQLSLITILISLSIIQHEERSSYRETCRASSRSSTTACHVYEKEERNFISDAKRSRYSSKGCRCLSRLTKSVRSRRRKENEGCYKICLIRLVNPPLYDAKLGPVETGPSRLLSSFPESSSSSSTSSFSSLIVFHSILLLLSSLRFVSFGPLSLSPPFPPARLLRKGCEVGGTRSQTPREY